jgi:dynein heavy chain
LKAIVEQFAPFFYLWDTAESWKSSYQSWMNDPFDTLNAEEIDEKVNGWFKGLFKTLHDFQKREIVSQATSCELIRKQMHND